MNFKLSVITQLVILAFILASCGGGSSSSGGGTSFDLTGTWRVEVAIEPGQGFVGGGMTLNMVQTENSVSGTFTNDPPPAGSINCFSDGTISGSVSGNKLTVQLITQGATVSGTMTGTSDFLSGTGTTVFDGTFCSGTISWSAEATRVGS